MLPRPPGSVGACLMCSGTGKQGIFGPRGLGFVGKMCDTCAGSGENLDWSSQISDHPGELQGAFVPGASVRIHGVRSQVEFNGQTVVLQELIDRDTGVWHVKLRDGKSKQVSIKNLELLGTSIGSASASMPQDGSSKPASSTSKEDVAQPESTFTEGMLVKLHGIKGRPEMNGQVGIFERFHDDRCVVRLDKVSKIFFPANLHPADSDPANSFQLVFTAERGLGSVASSDSGHITASVATPDEVAVPLPVDLLKGAASGNIDFVLERRPRDVADADLDPVQAVLATPDAVPVSKGSAVDLLKAAARGSLNSALQQRPRDERIMRSALKLSERANLSEDELLPINEALVVEERKARARFAPEAVSIDSFYGQNDDVVVVTIGDGRAEGLEDHEIIVAHQELQPGGPVGEVDGSASSSRDQNFDVVD